jgi:hypothetical protein
MESLSLDKIRFSPHEKQHLYGSLSALGFPRSDHDPLLELLICVAEEHHPLFISASRAPRISDVRHDLQELAKHLRDHTELLTGVSIEAWNAILGRYPASIFDINTYATGPSANFPNSFSKEPLALPLDIAASQDITSSALAHSFINLHWEWHHQNEIHYKLVRLEQSSTWANWTKNKADNYDRTVLRSTSELLTGRLTLLTLEERAQLLIVVDWALRRVSATCVPKMRPNTGKRTTFNWANGFLDRILAANVISALWQEYVPARLPSRIVADVIDLIKAKASNNRDSVEIAHVTHILWLKRQYFAHEAALNRLFGEMDELNQKNIGLNRKLVELPDLEWQGRLLSVLASRKQINSLIRKNVQTINEKDSEYAALTASLKEIKRRLRSGDYQPPSRGRIPNISGRAQQIKTLDLG